ncbi:MAG: hypothetical protein ACYCY8_09940 [Burkholderiales bacterium]
MKKFFVLLALLSGCSGQPDAVPQKWEGFEVRVETQPSPPRSGMNEVMVEVSGKHGKGVHGLIVSLRTGDSEPWKQTFPDGDLGVYHGAANLGPGHANLQVMIEQGGRKEILYFPFRMAASGS